MGERKGGKGEREGGGRCGVMKGEAYSATFMFRYASRSNRWSSGSVMTVCVGPRKEGVLLALLVRFGGKWGDLKNKKEIAGFF